MVTRKWGAAGGGWRGFCKSIPAMTSLPLTIPHLPKVPPLLNSATGGDEACNT
jgi:hypothetical protein